MLVAGHNPQKTMLGADKLKHRNTKKSFTTLKLIAQIGAMNRNKKKNGENNIIPVEEEWRGTKMEDGEDVKNQQQLFVAKMTEDNFFLKNKKELEEKQKEISNNTLSH